MQCKSNSIPNANRSACIPCGIKSKANNNNDACICETEGANYVLDSTGCYDLSNHTYSVTSAYISYLPRVSTY